MSYEIFDVKTMQTKYVTNTWIASPAMVIEIDNSDDENFAQYMGQDEDHSEDEQYIGLPGHCRH